MNDQPQDPVDLPDEEERDDAVIGRAFGWSLAGILLLAAVAGGTAIYINWPDPEPEVVREEVDLPSQRATPKVELPQVAWVDVTDEAGIGFRHENGAYGAKLLPETMGGGCAVLDFDNDGDQDILCVNSSRWGWDPRPAPEQAPTLAFYRNDGGWKFTDVTAEVGLDISCYGMGAAVGDYDNDGDTDLFVTCVGPNRLLENRDGRFLDVTRSAGVAGAAEEWSTSCAWFDYDNDGRLDLFVCNYIQWSREIDLAQDFRLVGVGRAYGPPTSFRGTSPYLYHNEGDGTFRDVTVELGIEVKNPATDVHVAKSLGVVPVDLDNDGFLDLVVSNDTVQNFVYHNQKGERFEEIGVLTGIAFDREGRARGAMGIDAAHHRNDGTLSVAIGNFANEMTALYTSMGTTMQFMDAAEPSGLGAATKVELTFGVFFFDYDLDGRLDLVSSNGHLEEEISKVQELQRYEQPPRLFWNAGFSQEGEFLPVPPDICGADFTRPLVGRGATYADFDGDGDLDILVMAVGGKPRLLRNDQQTNNHWLRVKLEGRQCNRSAIGARVTAHLGETSLTRYLMPTRSYLAQSELVVSFGLGDSERVDRLEIVWPGGATQELQDVTVNQELSIEQ